MLIYILKFSACLAIFMVFYKLFLERENMHHIKRYYLLFALLLSICIPLITFVQYIEPVIVENLNQSFEIEIVNEDIEYASASINYTPIILWSIYGLGFLIFAIKFSLNLFHIYKKIKRNPKYKAKGFINVLLEDLVTPHTFFSYIFLNKNKFEAQEIPKEVFIHEQTHSTQKHSLDVLFIELLQVVFWFNPLLYLIKKDIKLNHEFLADQAVLKNGIQPSEYQKLLLAFSSNAQHVELANAINYSSIKKRFTVMRTHTSKQRIWLKSFLLLPLIALTLYGFSQKKEVEKPTQGILTSQSEQKAKEESCPILEISFNPELFKLNGKKTSLFKLKEDFAKVTKNEESDLRIKTFGGIKMSLIDQIADKLKGNLKQIRLDESAYIIGDTTSDVYLQTATKEEVAEYNEIAKHINGQIETKSFIVKTKDVKRLEELYAKMSNKQKETSEPYPDFSKFPPPPSPATGFVNANGETLFVVYYVPKRYYNKKGYLVDKNGKTLNGNIQVNASDVLPGQYITKVYQNGKVVAEFKDNMPEQQKATPEEVAEYNKLAKIYNAQPEEKRVVKLQDLKRLETIYNKMTKEQKAKAESFPNCPQPKTNSNIQQKATQKEVDAYNTWAKKIHSESTRYISGDGTLKGTLLPVINKQDLKFFEIYNRMSLQQKNQSVEFPFAKENEQNFPLVPPPTPPLGPKTPSTSQKIIQNTNVPSPTPPPAPKPPLDHVIEMAKKGALFYYEDKLISSDEAIQLLKKNDQLNISTKQSDSKNPKAYISKEPITIKDSKKRTGMIESESIPKPTAKNAVNHLKVMNRHNAKFYLDETEVSFEDALKAVRKNKNANISTTTEPAIVQIESK